MDVAKLKQQAAEHAVTFIESGMVVGLGHGSTAIFAVRRIAERIQQGNLRDVVGIPVSKHIEREANRLGIPLTDFEQHPVVDVTIDGADEVDPQFNLIKGGGGALLREKIVAQASRRVVIVVDESKLSNALGSNFKLPVEVIAFGWYSQLDRLKRLGATWTVRTQDDGTPFITDQGNHILDGVFEQPINDPHNIARALEELAIVVQHGLFLGLATDVVIAGQGGITHKQR